MASNSYYGGYEDPNTRKALPNRPQQNLDSSYNAYRSEPYNQTFIQGYQPSIASTAPPSYVSRPGLHPPGPPSQREYNASPASDPSRSPFETPFDDAVYATSSHQPSAASSQQYLNRQENLYQHRSRTPSDDNLPTSPAIPLKDRSGKPGVLEDGMNDVYEVPRKSGRKKRKVQFGELGMLGAYTKRIPWVVYLFTTIQIAVFIGEIVRNAQMTGSPIMTKPSFNPMIGPSPYILINMGARFVPCMHNVHNITDATFTISWPCPNSTTTTQECTLSELCGFGGIPEPYYNATASIDNKPEPNQWFRFIVPMFMHAGIVHIAFNMLLQLTLGREMEKSIGPIRFFLVYVSSGIFGFVFGGNYAAVTLASTGASGSLFGIIALTLLDLLYSWKDRKNPVKDLMFILLDVVISFVLGLLPGLDNYSHIGGFLMGLALGISVLHSPNSLRRRIGEDQTPYSTVSAGQSSDSQPSFFRNPLAFFKGRKGLWWAWWLVRVGALIAVLIVFIVLLNNFYVYHVTCSWCKYLSCLPVNGWCENGLVLTPTTQQSSKRDFITGLESVAFLTS